jgi:hypothetical protein
MVKAKRRRGKVEPAGKPITPTEKTFAREGQRVWVGDDRGNFGVIVAVSSACCSIRTDKGTLIAQPWAEVLLAGAEPAHNRDAAAQPKTEAELEQRYRDEEQAAWKEIEGRPAQRWEATDDETGEFVGLLISERGNPDKVIAFLPVPSRRTYKSVDDMDEWAEQLEQHPEDVIGLNKQVAIDLRRFARVDSAEPTPEFLYRIDVRRREEPAKFKRRLYPFCRFRLARLLQMHNVMEWPPEKRDATFNFSENIVGINDPANGSMQASIDVSATDLNF